MARRGGDKKLVLVGGEGDGGGMMVSEEGWRWAHRTRDSHGWMKELRLEFGLVNAMSTSTDSLCMQIACEDALTAACGMNAVDKCRRM